LGPIPNPQSPIPIIIIVKILFGMFIFAIIFVTLILFKN
jgi:hypothetical protein